MITGTLSKGYMGATRWDGVKSKEHLYGSDLSKAVRTELKAQGIKGVTVKASTFAGGQELVVTIKPAQGDFVSFEEYKKSRSIEDYVHDGESIWLDSERRWLSFDEYQSLPKTKQSEVFEHLVTIEYRCEQEMSMLQYNYEKCEAFTEQLKKKIGAILSVIRMFNYDDTNSQVDYFDTNFYYNIKLKGGHYV